MLAGALVGTLLSAGCASAPVAPEISAEPAREGECPQSARHYAGEDLWVRSVGSGIASVAVGALRGAADGLSNAFQAGTSSGQSAWIGAAAGAGLGLVVGMAVGAARALRAQLAPHSAYAPCMGDGATAPARDAAVLAAYEPATEKRR